MKTYTEEEIKAYFDYMIKRYAGSPAGEKYEMMKFTMFDTRYGNIDTIEAVTKKLKNNDNKKG